MRGYIHFSPTGDLNALSAILALAAEDKQRDKTPCLADYERLATERMLDWFTPVSDKESKDLAKTFDGLTRRQIVDLGLIPGRSFRSMICNILDAEYCLLQPRDTVAWGEVVYQFAAAPYGGNLGLLALLECSGNRPTGYEDGSGYRVHSSPLRDWWRRL